MASTAEAVRLKVRRVAQAIMYRDVGPTLPSATRNPDTCGHPYEAPASQPWRLRPMLQQDGTLVHIADAGSRRRASLVPVRWDSGTRRQKPSGFWGKRLDIGTMGRRRSVEYVKFSLSYAAGKSQSTLGGGH